MQGAKFPIDYHAVEPSPGPDTIEAGTSHKRERGLIAVGEGILVFQQVHRAAPRRRRNAETGSAIDGHHNTLSNRPVDCKPLLVGVRMIAARSRLPNTFHVILTFKLRLKEAGRPDKTSFQMLS